MTTYLPLTVLSFSNCESCRRCCRFSIDELPDAPAFTASQRERILADIEPTAQFTPRRGVWQIDLRPLPGSRLYECPLYDATTARCRGYDLDIFDCRTWPFYAVHDDTHLWIAYSPTCPSLSGLTEERIRSLAVDALPRIRAGAYETPDLVIPMRTDLQPIIQDVPWPPPQSARPGSPGHGD